MQERTEVLGENLRGQVWIENQIHIRLWPEFAFLITLSAVISPPSSDWCYVKDLSIWFRILALFVNYHIWCSALSASQVYASIQTVQDSVFHPGGVLKFGFGRDEPPRNLKVDPYKYQFFKKK